MFLFSILGAVVISALYWLGGYDFNERGSTAVSCAMFSMWGAFIGGFISTLIEEKP